MAFQTRAAPAAAPAAAFASAPASALTSALAPPHPHPPARPPPRPSFLGAARQIYREGNPAPGAGTSTSAAFHRFPLLKFYRGFTVSIAGMVPYAGTAFLTWGFLRAQLLPARPANSSTTSAGAGAPRGTPLADLGIGALAGAIAQMASYPFEVVRRRMQVGGLTRPERWLRWGETARAVWARGGWRGFYVGLGIGYLKIVPMNAVSFAVWQGMKRWLEV